MALTGSGTSGDPYIINEASDIDVFEANDGVGVFWEFGSDVNYGGVPPRIDVNGNVDMKGYTLSGITGLTFGSFLLNLNGSWHNGTIDLNITTNDGNPEALVNGLRGTGGFYNMTVSGTLTVSGTAEGKIINIAEADVTLEDCLFSVNMECENGLVALIDAGNCTARRITYTGTMSKTGTGSLVPGNTVASVLTEDCFYDSTKTTNDDASNTFTGKTTSELQDLTTYTDTATTGLTVGYDMISASSHDGLEATATWSIEDGSAYPVLYYDWVAVSEFASGTITLSGVAQANAVVDIISCPTVSEGTKTIVEQVTANGSGVYTATVERNTALNYWAEPRHYVEEFTGTLTPVSGTTFSTGADLSGVSIGGANDPLYVLKSTGGTASGNEVVVESRSGNDITLSYDPGFDETTTFSLGKAYGTNTVLARSTAS